MPRGHTLSPIAGAVAIALVLSAAPALADNVASFADAMAQARARNVPVLVDFATTW